MITAIGDVMRRCYDKGWITTRDGNASLRRAGSNYIHITPSGVRKNKIEVESILKLKIINGELFVPDGQPIIKASGEIDMHYFLLRFATKTRAVVHVHPTHVIAAMYAGFKLDELAKQFPEIHRYTRVGPNVPNLPAVSRELADATYGALCHGSPKLFLSSPEDCLMHDIVGQANHGVCAVAGDPWSAYEHIERLDHICEIVLKSGVRP
jgi:ribulose-5-phosphate 4-epimerase/fuculose-1-phosphate aldolase